MLDAIHESGLNFLSTTNDSGPGNSRFSKHRRPSVAQNTLLEAPMSIHVSSAE